MLPISATTYKNAIFDQQRRITRFDAIVSPDAVRVSDVAGSRGVNALHSAEVNVVNIVFSVRHIDHVAFDYRRCVESATRHAKLSKQACQSAR